MLLDQQDLTDIELFIPQEKRAFLKETIDRIASMEKYEESLSASIDQLKRNFQEEERKLHTEYNTLIKQSSDERRKEKEQRNKENFALQEKQALLDARLRDLAVMEDTKKDQDARHAFQAAKEIEFQTRTSLLDAREYNLTNQRLELTSALSAASSKNQELQAAVEANAKRAAELSALSASLERNQESIDFKVEQGKEAEKKIAELIHREDKMAQREEAVKKRESELADLKVELDAETNNQSLFRDQLNEREKALEKLSAELESRRRHLDQKELTLKVVKKNG